MPNHTTVLQQVRRTKAEMFPLMATYEQGSLSQQAFCDRYGLNIAVLNYWLSKYRKESEGQPSLGQLVPLSVSTKEVEQASALEIQLVDGTMLRFDRLPPCSYLEELLRHCC
jgi:hypothetical protein